MKHITSILPIIAVLLLSCTTEDNGGNTFDITLSGNGNVWGAIAYAVLMLVITYAFSYFNFMFGYRAGSSAIMDFLEKGLLNKLLKGASIMGCMVMGGLIVNYVNVKCGTVITTSGSTFALQESLFDAVLPNILPLGVTMGVYGLMQKKWTSVKIILAIVLVGVVGGLLNILA